MKWCWQEKKSLLIREISQDRNAKRNKKLNFIFRFSSQTKKKVWCGVVWTRRHSLTARHSPEMNTQRKEKEMKRKNCACNTKEAQRKFSILSVGSKSFDSKKKFLPQKANFLVWHVSQNPQGNRSSFLNSSESHPVSVKVYFKLSKAK